MGVSAEKDLDAAEAKRRLEETCPNVLARDSRGGIPRILWRQINDPLMYVLLGSGTLAVLLGKGADSIVVFAVVVLNVIIGFVQEYRANWAIDALMDMVPDDVAVLRDGSWTSIPSGGVVPGDVVALVSGDKVPADARLVEVRGLQIDEAALTGESLPVSKHEDSVPEDAPVADRKCMAYGGMLVSYGTATAVVSATGMETELGRISSMLEEATETETPLTRQISTVSKWITVAIAAVAVVLLVGLLHYFSGPDGADADYLGRVRKRFHQWILDTCRRPYDQEWLDYQQEIGLRHTHEKKNETDGAHGTPNHISMWYMIGFIYPITATMKPFLDNKGHPAEEVEKMHQAWFKSVVMQVTLWCLPYAKDGYF